MFDGLSIYQIGGTDTNYITVKNGSIACSDSAPYTLYTPDNLCNAKLFIGGSSSHWTFLNESIGPGYDSSICGNGDNINLISGDVSDITFSQVTFHDDRYPDQSECGGVTQHTENLFISTGASGTITNLTFDRVHFINGAESGKCTAGVCDGSGPDTGVANVSAASGTGTYDHFVMSNTIIEGPGSTWNSNVDAQYTNGSIIEYSDFIDGGPNFECSTGTGGHCPSGYTDLTFRGVISYSSGSCIGTGVGGITFQYNIWYKPQFNGGTPSKCGPNDLVLTNPNSSTDIRSNLFNNWTAGDYTLVSGSPAISFVPTSTGCVANDYSGAVRPNAAHTASCSAGAYESSDSGSPGGGILGDLNSDGHVNITDLSILLSHYGIAGTAAQGDINSDGSINVLDLSILLSHYGT